MSLKTALTVFLGVSALSMSLALQAAADPTHSPPPPDLSQARIAGQNDGTSDGAREGNERGFKEGQQAGLQEGYRAGYDKCGREQRQHEYDEGFREGLIRGQTQGAEEGTRRGQADGVSSGQRDGNADGIRRADTDALRDATPPGTAQGIDQANHSDAAQRGYQDGLVAGDREARERAQAYDYPRGRDDDRKERFAEPIENNEHFSEGGHGFENLLSDPRARLSISKLTAFGVPDDRYYNPRKTYPTPAENDAYKSAYRAGYNSGFATAYNSTREAGYRQGYDQSYPNGCRDGRAQNFSQARQEGFEAGKSEGYRQAYQPAFDNAYRQAYDFEFRNFSEHAYRDNYQNFYNVHFEEARARAFSARVQELYNDAFSSAKTQKFNEVYPGYADQQYRRGRQDEEADFAAKPLRVLSTEVLESIPNGVLEPGEALHLKIQVRNFSAAAIAGRDVRIKLEALDPSSAVISQAEAVLSHDLKRKSLTTITDLLAFRFNESAVDKTSRFKVSIVYQGKVSSEDTLELGAKFLAGIRFAQDPEVHEGLPAELLFKVKNQSNLPTDAALTLKLSTRSSEIELVEGSAQPGILNPGEERVVKFVVIARGAGSSIQFPLVVEATSGNRRVGLLTFNEEVPIINDYKITIKTALSALRNPGTIRAEYLIEDVSQRIVLKGLQLKVKVTGDAAQAITVLGPNPQYLNPLTPGETTRFVIPFAVTSANHGGTIELEVQEDGRSVVIHRAQF